MERDLADELRVSRVPIREALRQLVKEGLVSVVPHRGAVVSSVSPSLVVDVFSVRVALESMAARVATLQISDRTIDELGAIVAEMESEGRDPNSRRLVQQDLDFHRTLVNACNRPVLLEALDAIWNRTSLLISASRPAYPLERIGELHRPILDAVCAKDPDRVEEAVRVHLAFGETVLLKHLTAVESEHLNREADTIATGHGTDLSLIGAPTEQAGVGFHSWKSTSTRRSRA